MWETVCIIIINRISMFYGELINCLMILCICNSILYFLEDLHIINSFPYLRV